MIDFEYLSKGVYGLANAHRASVLSGHLGAAVAAGYFFGEDQGELDEVVYRGVEKELDRIMAGEEAFWFNAKKSGITAKELFEPLPEGQPQERAISQIAAALSKNIDRTRQSGHNVIFASIAIRALRDHPEFATPAIVNGVRKLIEGFNEAHAGRGYYGKPKGWLTGNQVKLSDTDNGFSPYEDERHMVRVVIDEVIATASIRKQGFGGLWHVINHAAALKELSRCGYEDLAKKGLPAHHHHVRLWRSLPDVESELGATVKSKLDPRKPDYWKGMLKRDEAQLTHRIKTMYGFFTILRFVEDEKTRGEAEDAFLYLMA